MKGTDRFRNRRRPAFIGIFILGAVFLAGAAVMLLWNAILPDVAGLKPLGYWQALGLLVLCRMLFGGFRFGPGRPGRFGRHRMREKFMDMTEEERAAFRAKWEDHCKKN